MNEKLKEIVLKYKPLKYTLKGKTINVNSMQGNFVIKPAKRDIISLFSYLNSRSFYNYPKVIAKDDDYITYEYLKELETPKEQQLLDLVLVVAKLHNKTVYFKEVTEDKYKEIYDNIKDNVIYLRDYYSGIYDEAFNEIYISPAKYNFLLNYSLLNNDLAFILDELDEWFNLVKESNKQRVCLIHNNLSLEHFVKGMDSYLISWDKYTFDTPVMDIVNLYHNEYLTCDFSGILKEYLKNFKLSVDEEKLLFILLSLPDKVNFDDSEFNNTINVANLVDYIKRTEKLIRPYYTEKQKEED
mgnify:CR=1 FL=1